MHYEFHLTVGDPRLVRSLNTEKNWFTKGTPTLAIENLDEKGFPAFTDWMTAEKVSLQGGHIAALRYLANCQNEKGWHNYTIYEPIRLKIEVEYTPESNLKEYLYVETHWSVTPEEAIHISKRYRSRLKNYRLSRNLYSGKLIATERCYSQSQFREFIKKHANLDHKVELCLLDTNVRHDAEEGWMRVPKKIGIISETARKTLSDE